MKIIKIILINFFVFIALVVGVECLFRINAYLMLVPKINYKEKYVLIPESTGSDIVADLGADIFKNVPEVNKIKQDPRVIKYKYEDIDQNKYPPGFFGNHPKSEYRIVEKIKNSDVVVYDAKYKFDSDGFRHVEHQDNKVQTQKFVLAAGDSFTFGEGTSQGFDYPSQLASKLGPEWKVYNYGRPGFGPNDFYARSRSSDFFKNIKEKEGVFIWLYIDSHLQRMICTTSCKQEDPAGAYIFTKNDYELRGNEIIDYGKIKSSLSPKRLLIRLLRHSEFFKFFGRDFPRLYDDENYRLFFSLLDQGINKIGPIVKIKKYIVLYDYVPHYELFKKEAAAFDFEIIRLAVPGMLGQNFHREIIPDGHPSSDNYWIISELLKQRINNLK